MYQDVGKKIMKWAKACGYLAIAAGIISAIVVFFVMISYEMSGEYDFFTGLYTKDDSLSWASGILIWECLLAGFCGYVFSWLLFGFGQIIDELHDCKEYLRSMHETQEKIQISVPNREGIQHSVQETAHAQDNDELPDL